MLSIGTNVNDLEQLTRAISAVAELLVLLAKIISVCYACEFYEVKSHTR